MGCDGDKLVIELLVENFNPRSPNGLRLVHNSRTQCQKQFQSTQPEWAATISAVIHATTEDISIHAARMGCDCCVAFSAAGTDDFNPRSPNGLRQEGWRIKISACKFQSTQPEWAATDIAIVRRQDDVISIHAARMGCDSETGSFAMARTAFQSTQPEWAATCTKKQPYMLWIFQSTQPEWAATQNAGLLRVYITISIHAARMGCDVKGKTALGQFGLISIHAARMGCDG